jgi:glycosyltransferase involved in cell wall biosynthesis
VQAAEAAAIAASDQIWLCSDADRERAGQTYGTQARAKARVVPNAVPVPRRPSAAGRPEYVLFTGRFDYYPNLAAYRYLTEAIIPALRRCGFRTPVVVAGAAAGHALAGAPVPPGTRIIADPPDMTALLRSGMMTVPLTLGGGTRFKILEAAAIGAPVISTAKGAEGLGFTDRVHFLRAEGPAEFAEAIGRTLRDDATRRALSAEAFRFVRRYYSAKVLAATVRDRLAELA